MPVKPVSDEDSTTARHITVRLPGLVYRTVRALVRAICATYFRVTTVGADKVPGEGPVILAPVHRSFIDFFVITEVTRRKIFYMAKEEMWKVPLLGHFLDATGAFPVDRDGADRLALDRAQDVLERGDVLVLFPEGTRRSGPDVVDLRDGAAFLAARTGATIVPVGVGGTAAAMPKGSHMVRPVKVRLVVGDPIAAPARSARGRVPRSQVRTTTEQLAASLQAVYAESEGRASR